MNVTRFINVRQTRQTGHLSRETGHFRCKMAQPCIFGSALRAFLKFCPMKAVKKYMEIILMVFLKKKSHLGLMVHFRPKNGTCI